MNATFLKDLPAELQGGDCFVAWRYEERDKKKTKVPVNPRTGGNASVTDPSTWSSLEGAIRAIGRFGCSGVGRVVVSKDGYRGIDLDKCRDPQTGKLTPLATTIVKTLNSYTEITPSCCGVRIWIRATLPGPRCRKDGVEIYADRRYFTLTGNHLPNTPGTVETRHAELEHIYKKLFPGDAKANGSNGHNKETGDPWTRWRRVPDDVLVGCALKNPKFKRLWDGDTSEYGGDDSRADLALCCNLAFWTGKDPERIESLFNQSKLADRDKWRKREDYRRRTISNAIDNTPDVWTPTVGHVQATGENGWPDPSPLGDDLPPVDSFALELLPQSLRPLVEDISDRMQTPPDFAAIAGIVALAGCVNRRALIRPKVEDNWTVTPNLWGAIIGHPGS
jgi:putative DNA primase/helicase